MSERLVDVAVVARGFAVSCQRVRDWIEQGKIQAVRLPSGRYKIPYSELERLRNSQIQRADQ